MVPDLLYMLSALPLPVCYRRAPENCFVQTEKYGFGILYTKTCKAKPKYSFWFIIIFADNNSEHHINFAFVIISQDRVKYRIVRAGAERGAGQTHFENDASMELTNSHMI